MRRFCSAKFAPSRESRKLSRLPLVALWQALFKCPVTSTKKRQGFSPCFLFLVEVTETQNLPRALCIFASLHPLLIARGSVSPLLLCKIRALRAKGETSCRRLVRTMRRLFKCPVTSTKIKRGIMYLCIPLFVYSSSSSFPPSSSSNQYHTSSSPSSSVARNAPSSSVARNAPPSSVAMNAPFSSSS